MSLSRPAPAGERPLRLVEVPEPEPADHEVLLAVSTCGVCRTDLHIVEGDLTPPSYPVVPGHQVVGRVETVGSAVTEVRVGDRVGAAWLGSVCGTCDSCRDHRENLCLNPTFTGFHRQGGFAQRMTAPAAFVHPIPKTLGDDLAVAPLLCAGIIGYRALKQSGLKPGRSVALYGFGAAAHIALQVAKGWGCEVFVVSRGDGARERAQAMGADWTGASTEDMPHPVQHAVDFAPAGSVIPPALAALAPGGVLSIAGIYVDRIPELDYDRHLFQERSMVSTTANTRGDARELLALAAELGIHTDVERFALDQANQALERLAAGKLTAQAGVLQVS